MTLMCEAAEQSKRSRARIRAERESRNKEQAKGNEKNETVCVPLMISDGIVQTDKSQPKPKKGK